MLFPFEQVKMYQKIEWLLKIVQLRKEGVINIDFSKLKNKETYFV